MTGIVWWDGDQMSILPAEEGSRRLLVLYEDNHLLVVFKPAGLLVQGPASGQTTILDVARAWIQKAKHTQGRVYVGLVHRLDRPVAGVLVLAKTSKAASRLCAQFRQGTVRKTYQAVVEGRAPAQGSFEATLARASGLRRSLIRPGQGKAASLTFRTLDTTPEASLVEVVPHTGRTHQIRAQLAWAGHPILGDVKYGSRVRLKGRIALLAREIVFVHPTRQVEVHIHAPVPPDWPWPPPLGLGKGRRG